MEKRPCRVSDVQWDLMIEFLKQHPTLTKARGYNNSARGRAVSARLWQEIADKLNAEVSGTTKTAKEWSIYVSNFKSKLKTLVTDMNTGGGRPLNEIEEQFLSILGSDFNQTTSRVTVDPFSDLDIKHTPDSSTPQANIMFANNQYDEFVPSIENPLSSAEAIIPACNDDSTSADIPLLSLSTSNCNTKERITAAQMTALSSFVENNPEVVCGYKKTLTFKDVVQSKWKKITPRLNSLGKSRDHKGWAKYLCNVKAKLRRKKIKWKQIEGSGPPVMSNADEFNEIELRMIQVLKKSKSETYDSHDSIDSNSSDIWLDDIIKKEKTCNDDQNISSPDETDIRDKKKVEKNNTLVENNRTDFVFIKLPNEASQITDPNISHNFCMNNNLTEDDEFYTFGRNIAQQLKMMPLSVALETEEIIISVLRKQRLKVFNDQKDYTLI